MTITSEAIYNTHQELKTCSGYDVLDCGLVKVNLTLFIGCELSCRKLENIIIN